MKKEQLNFIKSYTELEKLSKEKLIGLILDKDETIEYLGECLGNLEYIGRMYLKEDWYSFYIKKENKAVA